MLERRIVTTYNPFRYRGYYYDTETQWYYLQTRYYNPNWGRFISADGYISTGTGLLGYNMYAYCNNNPINLIDPQGEFPWILVVIIAVLIPSLTSCSTDNNSRTKVANTVHISVNPGTFETVQDAVENFGYSYLDRSIREDREYGTVIYEEEIDGKIYYTYSVVSIGGKKFVALHFPKDKVYVAVVHTHGAETRGEADEEFSPGDKRVAESYNIPAYLFGPSTWLYYYDPYLNSSKQIPWSGGQ